MVEPESSSLPMVMISTDICESPDHELTTEHTENYNLELRNS